MGSLPHLIGAIIACALLLPGGFAQTGAPLFYNILPSDYEDAGITANPQNWDLVQDSSGMCYVANTSGILCFDGERWKTARNSEGKYLFNFTKSGNGKIFAGGRSDLGYLSQEVHGTPVFTSLKAQLPSLFKEKDNLDIRMATSSEDAVYFLTTQALLRWQNDTFHIWESETGYLRCLEHEGKVLVLETGKGLFEIQGNKKVMVADAPAFLNPSFRTLIPWNNKWLVGTKSKGLFLWDGNSLAPFATWLSQDFPDLIVRDLLALPNGEVAVATHTAGILIIDSTGSLVAQLYPQKGVHEPSVIKLCLGKEGGLWACLDNGLAFADYPAPLTFIGPEQGLSGFVNCVISYQKTFYAGTTKGLFVWEEGSRRFTKVPGLNEGVWDLCHTNGHLLIAGSEGMFSLGTRQLEKISGLRAFSCLAAPNGSGTVFWAMEKGIGRVQAQAGGWEWQGIIPETSAKIQHLSSGGEDEIWAAGSNGTVFQLTFPSGFHELPRVKRFDSLPGALKVWNICHIGEKLLFPTDMGIYSYHRSGDTFQPDPAFGDEEGPFAISLLQSDAQGNIWVSNGKRHGRLIEQEKGKYTWTSKGLDRLQDIQVLNIYPGPGGIIWFTTPGGLYRYKTSSLEATPPDFSLLLRKVILNRDSLLRLDGQEYAEGLLSLTEGEADLDFEWAAPCHLAPEETQYRFILEGYDKKWGEWSDQSSARYTSLRNGDYTMIVQARNRYYPNEQEVKYRFTILPLWYQTGWAFGLYIALVLLGGYGSFRFLVLRKQARKAIQDQEELQRKLEAEQQLSERLKSIDRLKDEFLANTSHELRTPLHGIIGLAESLAEGKEVLKGDSLNTQLRMIAASGRRLSNLVNDILDFSRLKNEELELRKAAVDLHSLADVVLQLSRPLIAGKEVNLVNQIPRNLAPAQADQDRLQQILYNLVGNAIKFTEQGSITLSATENDEFIRVEVTDTGIGIPAEKQEAIFQSFEQADGSISRVYGGTGLGLPITRKLVELHGGNIGLSSVPGKGSSFYFTLPKSRIAAKLPPKQEPPGPQADPQPEKGVAFSPPVQEAGKIRVLIVDDEPINHLVLTNHLGREDYAVTSAMSGQEALEFIEQASPPFDLVLLDIMMPRMSGYEVCDEIRKRFLPSELPVILITAKNQVEDLVQGLSYGANDYLAKPFNRAEFLARIKTHLDLHRIHRAASHFVPFDFLRALGKESITDVKLGDHATQEVTVLYCDIRSYPTLAEQMSPEENFRFLNDYLGRIGPVVKECGGFVNQYYGDGTMALFLARPQDALQAAVGIQRQIARFNQERAGLQAIDVVVALHSGPLMMGILGDTDRMDTGVVADAVTFAVQLEGLSQMYGASILITESVFEALENPQDFHFRWMGKIRVKGRKGLTKIFECFDGDEAGVKDIKKRNTATFEEALDAYFRRDFSHAARCYKAVLLEHPEDPAAKYYLKRAASFMVNGVEEDWTGAEKIKPG